MLNKVKINYSYSNTQYFNSRYAIDIKIGTSHTRFYINNIDKKIARLDFNFNYSSYGPEFNCKFILNNKVQGLVIK